MSDKKNVKQLAKLKSILKDNYKELQDLSLIKLIDEKRLADTPASSIGDMIDNGLFTDQERASIREKRRRVINIKTANKSRLTGITEFKKLERELVELQDTKDGMNKEKQILETEIKYFKSKLYKAQMESEFLSYDLQLDANACLCDEWFYGYTS